MDIIRPAIAKVLDLTKIAYSRKKSDVIFHEYVVPLSIGLLFFLTVFSVDILNPSNINWLYAGGDSATSYLGWKFFRHTPLQQFPLGANPDYGIDISSSVVYSGLPLLALSFKYLNPILPDDFQYHGFWIIFCFIAQAGFSYKLIGYFTDDKVFKLIASCFFLLAPVFLWRLHGHYDLFGQWVLLAGLCLYFSDRFSIGWWIGLLSATALIHPYLLAMVGAIWVADLCQRCWKRERKVPQMLYCFLMGSATTILVMWLAGYFMVGGGVGTGGFGYYRMNLLSLIDSDTIWSVVLRDQPGGPGDYEGFNYLGLGMLVLALIAGYELLRKPKIAIDYGRFVPLLLISLALTVFALSNHVAIGERELITYPVPESLTLITSALRASGRMFWPVYYLVYLAVFYIVFSRLERPVAITVCTILLVIQIADSSAALSHFRNKFSNPPKWSSPLHSPLWADIGKQYRRIVYVLPRNAPDAFLPWAHFAAEHRMAINFGYFARIDPVKLSDARTRLAASIIDNELDPEALYVFEDEGPWALASNQAAESDMVGMLDGFRILAPKLKDCTTCDRAAMASVQIGESGHVYPLGERISFAYGGTSLKYTVLGWSGPEPWGTWSDGDKSILMLNLGEKSIGNLTLRIEAHAFVTEKHPVQDIEVFLNGHSLETLRYTAPSKTETRVIRIPSALVAESRGRLFIEFKFKDPKSPAELGLSTDVRRLGLGLVSLQIDPISDGACVPPGCVKKAGF